jgi:hypothetical protein
VRRLGGADGLLRFEFSPECCKHADGDTLQRVGQVVDQMPPVSHLECLGRATPGSTGADAITISADDLGTRMFARPIDERISRGIFQQIDNAMRIRIHQNRAVATSTSE